MFSWQEMFDKIPDIECRNPPEYKKKSSKSGFNLCCAQENKPIQHLAWKIFNGFNTNLIYKELALSGLLFTKRNTYIWFKPNIFPKESLFPPGIKLWIFCW